MPNDNTRIAILIGKRLDGSISEMEATELNDFMTASKENKLFVEQYDDDGYVNKELQKHYEFNVQSAWVKLVERANIPLNRPYVKMRWLLPAAAAILVLAILTWILIIPKDTVDRSVTSGKPVITNDVPPGGDRATLKLADGRVIILDSSSTGALAVQGGAQVIKTGDGSIKYEGGEKVLFNTLSTQKGGQFKLQLPDGSTCYLNASSSIKYPTVFVGNERRIEITGEVYFSVVKNPERPFKAYFNNDEAVVEVTGTEFNLNTYKDEGSAKTTLVEGKVKVLSTTNGESVNLRPGEQASLSQSHLSQPVSVQTDEITAWKDGLFYFENKTIPEILKVASRWYDIEVQYEYQPKEAYRVKVSRQVPISKMLDYLEAAGGVHFSIEGKTVIVKK